MNTAVDESREPATAGASGGAAIAGGGAEPTGHGIPPRALLAFAPLHKRALGTACGIAGGLAVFALTAFHLLVLGGQPEPARLLSQYFYGYEVSWKGAFIGLFWGFVSLFVLGWFAAFLRNFVLATIVFVARTREELRQTRDFLDHI